MPLTKRQKRRLIEISKMIDGSATLLDDMSEIQHEYAQEIDKVLYLIGQARIKSQPLPKQHERDFSGLQVFEAKENTSSHSKKTTDNTKEYQSQSNLEEDLPVEKSLPEWAKKLWKGIAKECHPDRLNFSKLSAVDVAKRQQLFLKSRKALETENWNKLLQIGVKLTVWVDELSHTTQLNMLNHEYSLISSKVEDIQGSLAWKWGTNWDNHELRVKIIHAVCNHKGIKVPPKLEIIQILVNLEIE